MPSDFKTYYKCSITNGKEESKNRLIKYTVNCDRGEKTYQWREKVLFHKWCWSNGTSVYKE